MRRRKLPIACLLAAVYCSLAPAAAAEPQKNDGAQAEAPGVAKGPAAELTAAHKLYLGGNYAEAQEKYEAAAAEHPLDAALGLARCLASEGKMDEAKKSLEAGLAQASKDVRSADLAKLHAELARLAFDAGDCDAAEKRVKQVLAVDEKNRQARWIDAELHRTAGRLVEAEAGYKYFVDDYNATDEFTDPDDLRYIGLGAAQYARWSRLSDQFTFLVNDLYPSAVELDADYWPARYEAGMLFLEKYNEPEAQKEFKAALVLNPRAAEVYAALAKLAIINFDMDAAKRSIQRALDINPKLLAAHWASADLHLANYEAAEAALVLEAALKLNPRSEETLGRLAAAYAVIDGVPQVIFAGGDGWLYSFKGDAGKDGKVELLWKFDANPKTSKYILGGRGTRNEIIATPVIYNDLVYLAVGQDPEHGEGIGHLWCIDPKKRGDISGELAFSLKDPKNPIPHRRLQAVIEEEGEVARPNPNSGVVWHYSEFDKDGNKKFAWEEQMHRTCGTVAIKDDLLYIADFSGLFHCVDAKTGVPYWTHDLLAACWGSAMIVDGKVYCGDEEGKIVVFKHSKEYEEPIVNEMGNSVYTTPVVANNKLFIANKTHVFCIGEAKSDKK